MTRLAAFAAGAAATAIALYIAWTYVEHIRDPDPQT